MFMTPLLREIYEYTYSAKFDMCNVASLKDPENHRFIQKGLEVRTTSHVVYSQLHVGFVGTIMNIKCWKGQLSTKGSGRTEQSFQKTIQESLPAA